MADVTILIEAIDKATPAITKLSLGAAAALAVAGKAAVDFDTAISGASRALDLSEKEVAGFKKQVLATAPALGLMPVAFAELATEAGKLGVTKDKIVPFATLIGELAAITDLSGEKVTKLASSFAALQTITGASTKDLEIYGAAVNKLDDSIGGTTPDIVEFTRQTAAAGKLLRLDIKDLAAYGSTMAALGIQNGVAYRSFNALLTKLAAPQTLSKTGQKALGDLGLSAQQMAKIMTTDANAGIDLFLSRIREVAATDVSKALGATKQIIGADFADEILTLAISGTKLKDALAAVGDTTGNLAKKKDELAKKLGNVKGQMAIAQSQMTRLAIIIGEAALPSINSLLALLVPLANKFADFAQANPFATQIIVGALGLIAAIAPLAGIIGAISGAFSVLGGIATAVMGAIGIASLPVTAPILAIAAAVIAVGAAIGALIANWDKVGPATASGLSSSGQVIHGFFSGIGNWIYNFFNGLIQWGFNAGQSFINTFGAGIQSAFGGIINMFVQHINYLRSFLPASDAQRGALSDLTNSGSKLWETFASGVNAGIPSAVDAVQSGSDRLLPVLPSSSSSTTNSPVSSSNITINFSPNINGGNTPDLIAALQVESRRLIDMLDSEGLRLNRGNL